MQKKIIIIDDYKIIVESISLILEDAGYEVQGMCDAAALYQKDMILSDLFLIDLHLKKNNSSDVCKYLKTNKKTQHIPIILMSGDKDAKQLAITLGVDDYLSKPFNIDDLLGKIVLHLQPGYKRQ